MATTVHSPSFWIATSQWCTPSPGHPECVAPRPSSQPSVLCQIQFLGCVAENSTIGCKKADPRETLAGLVVPCPESDKLVLEGDGRGELGLRRRCNIDLLQHIVEGQIVEKTPWELGFFPTPSPHPTTAAAPRPIGPRASGTFEHRHDDGRVLARAPGHAGGSRGQA